ncbi:endo-1,4-beta-xylanase [Shewanella japonica]|uniref:Beta-xylanase n=1 Tax=Shewanella japonica TaxID=93973 RepID=A0ABN4YPR3_9GAMM|nr:endo-1,4-beta-xylanase [Shewanella japonica]ARD24385.1 endo-1,4-beta-xylanase A [Shewanella japonica]
MFVPDNSLISCAGLKRFVPLLACLLLPVTLQAADDKTELQLKDHFAEQFKIGAALSEAQILDKKPGVLDLVAQQFNSLTAENVMKWEEIHPSPQQYNFSTPDKLVSFGQKHDMYMVGHTLLWHQQTPDWVFEDEKGNLLERDSLLERLQLHINTVLGQYKGKVQAWDVVNEAFNEDGTLRDSKWLAIIGPDYIEKAFEYAHQADADIALYYNDYNLFKPAKRKAVVKLVKQLQSKGIRIDGVGIQGHYALDYPDLNEVENSINAFADTGVTVMFTEVDVSVLPFPDEDNQGADISLDMALQQQFNPYADGLPSDVEQQLAQRYKQIIDLFIKHQQKIDRVTFWGVDDGQTWRNDWPMTGRTDYPLLFDRELQLKPFVKDIIN